MCVCALVGAGITSAPVYVDIKGDASDPQSVTMDKALAKAYGAAGPPAHAVPKINPSPLGGQSGLPTPVMSGKIDCSDLPDEPTAAWFAACPPLQAGPRT
jgi:hypothetical protein